MMDDSSLMTTMAVEVRVEIVWPKMVTEDSVGDGGVNLFVGERFLYRPLWIKALFAEDTKHTIGYMVDGRIVATRQGVVAIVDAYVTRFVMKQLPVKQVPA